MVNFSILPQSQNPWERNLLRNSSGEESRDKVGLLHTFLPTSYTPSYPPTYWAIYLLSCLPTYQPTYLRWGSAIEQRRISTQTGSTAGLYGPRGAAAGAWMGTRGETCASSPPTSLAARSRLWSWASSLPPGGSSTPSSRPSRWRSPTWQALAMARSTK